MTQLYQLFYVSEAAPDCQRDDILQILKTATRFNADRDLTGTLVSRGGYFLQLLEGNRLEVNALYERIKLDPRHRNAKIVFTKSGGERVFREWAMDYHDLTDQELALTQELVRWDDLVTASPKLDQDLILKLLARFKSVLPSSRT